MKNRPDLQSLIQEFKNLQLDQDRIRSRQAEIIDLLETAHTGSTAEDDRQAPRAQGTRQEEDTPPPATASQRTDSPTRKDKFGNTLRIGHKVQILTFAGLLRKDKLGIIVGFTPKRVRIKTGSPPEIILRAESNLVRVVDI